MSVETDFRAQLLGHAPLVALLGTGSVEAISENTVPQRRKPPYIAFVVTHDRVLGLGGAALAEQCSIACSCWALTADQAWLLAEAVIAAVDAAPPNKGAAVITAAGGYQEELELNAVELVIEWWN